jgi:hypothetical protein
VSTLITHRPAEESPDDDPTGVRDLLSSLPQPDPMPDYLVERINASLAAESAQRAATSSLTWGTSGTSVTALLAPARRRSGRLVFALAGAAAAVALFAVVGNALISSQSPTTSAITSGVSNGPAADRQTLTSRPEDKTLSGDAFSPPVEAPPVVQIRPSGTRYTQADFVTQVRRFGSAVMAPNPRAAAEAAAAGPVGTTAGLIDCLNAIGAAGSQLVRADLALYEGRPAVIIVATSNGKAMAYAVGRQCSRADAAVLHAATPLP